MRRTISFAAMLVLLVLAANAQLTEYTRRRVKDVNPKFLATPIASRRFEITYQQEIAFTQVHSGKPSYEETHQLLVLRDRVSQRDYLLVCPDAGFSRPCSTVALFGEKVN